jgi:DNA-binding CsgD family transcriptional regulator
MTELDMLESLSDCDTIEQLHSATRKIVASIGYEHFIYGVQVNTSLTRPYQFVFSGYPDQWRDRYVEAGYQDIDPTVTHCIKQRRVVPVIWDKRFFGSTKLSAQMMGEASECGLGSGVTLSIQGGHGEAAMLSLAGPGTPEGVRRDAMGTLGSAQLLACYLHEAIQRVVLSKQALPLQQPTLTGREKECLLWAAEGKTTWEIANILKLADRTVVFHLQNASRKMGVSTRQHAVARALSLGLVSP